MANKLIYIVTDGEFDGPVPGRNSMLSFASVAVTANGEKHGEFEAVLERLPGAQPNLETTALFWNKFPEAYAAATLNPQPPAIVMADFVKWVRGLGDCIFVSHPLALDGPWIDFYLQRFTNEFLLEGPWRPNRLFNGAPLCLMSYAAGKLGHSMQDNPEYPAEWMGGEEHTHRAIDDARGYANVLVHLMKLRKQE